jgi:hypothetical protein
LVRNSRLGSPLLHVVGNDSNRHTHIPLS